MLVGVESHMDLYSALCRMGYPLIQANALSWALLADERRMKMCW